MEIVIDIETYRSDLSPEQQAYRESGITAPSNYKDPIKTKRAIEEKKRTLYGKDAFDPLYGRIIAIGYMITDIDDIIVNPTVLIAKDEKALLIEFYKGLGKLDEPSGACYPITFNGTDFDIPFLNFRTMTHSITSHYRLQSLVENDVRNLLAQKYVKKPEHTLEEYAMHFKLPKLYKGITGKDMGKLWEEGFLKSIVEHCKSNVVLTWQLYRKSNMYYFNAKRRPF